MSHTENVSLQQIKELRRRTLIGIKDYKAALMQSKGDIEEAVDILKRTGRLKTNSRMERKSGNGAVCIYQNSTKLAMILQRCESEDLLYILKSQRR